MDRLPAVPDLQAFPAPRARLGRVQVHAPPPTARAQQPHTNAVASILGERKGYPLARPLRAHRGTRSRLWANVDRVECSQVYAGVLGLPADLPSVDPGVVGQPAAPAGPADLG